MGKYSNIKNWMRSIEGIKEVTDSRVEMLNFSSYLN